MSRIDIVILFSVIIGFVLFLYGSNAYISVVGWGGIVIIVAGFVAELVLEASSFLGKKRADQKP